MKIHLKIKVDVLADKLQEINPNINIIKTQINIVKKQIWTYLSIKLTF